MSKKSLYKTSVDKVGNFLVTCWYGKDKEVYNNRVLQ